MLRRVENCVCHFRLSLKADFGPDVVKFHSGLKRIYVSCSSGAISVFQEDDPDHFRKVEDFPVQKKVHSLAVDKDTHRVYAPEQVVDGRPTARMTVYEAVTGQAASCAEFRLETPLNFIHFVSGRSLFGLG